MNILRIVLTLIIIKDFEIGQVNVNNAFTKSTLKHFIHINTFFLIDVKQKKYLKLL